MDKKDSNFNKIFSNEPMKGILENLGITSIKSVESTSQSTSENISKNIKSEGSIPTNIAKDILPNVRAMCMNKAFILNKQSDQLDVGFFYLIFLIYKCGGFIYYRDVSISCKALFIEGIEIDGKIYTSKDLNKLGKDYITSKYDDEIFKAVAKINKLAFYGITNILNTHGYKIGIRFKSKTNNICIKYVEKDGDRIEYKAIKEQGRKHYNYILTELTKLYHKTGKIPKL